MHGMSSHPVTESGPEKATVSQHRVSSGTASQPLCTACARFLIDETEDPFGVVFEGEDDCAKPFEEFFPAPEFDVQTARCEFDALGQPVEARAEQLERLGGPVFPDDFHESRAGARIQGVEGGFEAFPPPPL